MKRHVRFLFARHQSCPMFSLSQYLIIGFAGSIYVVGTALLLTGHTLLQNSGRSPIDASEHRTTGTSGGGEGSPYFVPAFEEVVRENGIPEDPRSPAGGASAVEKQLRSVRGGLSPDHQLVEHANEAIPLLGEPICLN